MEPLAIETSPKSILALPKLPQELIDQILLRLPVKSLLRFKCVSKQWCSLISSPEFIKAHLRISTEDKKFSHHRVLLLPQGSPSTLSTCSLCEVVYGNSTVNPVQLDFPFQSINGKVSFVGSINGLLCMHIYSDDVLILWNPSIRQFKKLPISASKFITYGFGYDESTGDYKIVGFCNWLVDNGVYKKEVKCYSLMTNSFYKICDYLDAIIPANWFGKFVSGSLHWMAERFVRNSRGSGYKYIASFDIAAGTFEMISLPNFDEFGFNWCLEVLGGCLAVFCTDFCTQMHVHIMEDYAEKKWNKLISIPYVNDLQSFTKTLVVPVFLFGNGSILLSFGSNLVLYDGGESFVKKCGACNEDEAASYVESLVSPNTGIEIAFSTDEKRYPDLVLFPEIEFLLEE